MARNTVEEILEMSGKVEEAKWYTGETEDVGQEEVKPEYVSKSKEWIEALRAAYDLGEHQVKIVQVIIDEYGQAAKAIVKYAMEAEKAEARKKAEELDTNKGYAGEIVIVDEVHYLKVHDIGLSPKLTAAELDRVTKRETPKRRVHEDADARPRKGWQTCHGPAQRTRKGRA